MTLHTDLYQLTMAQGYWRLGMHQRQAVFTLFFREQPFQGGYSIACGLADVIAVIEQYAFTNSELKFLASLPSADGSPLFQPDFLQALSELQLTIHLDALEEGTLVFPQEPLLRIQGPLWECQLLESTLLNIMNFSTLIATKASRVCQVAGTDNVIEFGLRRAQGPNGALMASRAAFIGGVSATSNVLAGQQYGIELRGTHAHSWVMAFDSEKEAFEAYAKVLPNHCIFLVDTYKTLEGVQEAIAVGRKLQASGHPLLGIRLDSGDLASLSIASRELLDQAGFTETKIIASSDLDEYAIEQLKSRGARIDYWGVGTRLVTSYDQPALGGVYKLVALQDIRGEWQLKSKQTDDPNKKTIGGIYGIHRIEEKEIFLRDELYRIEPLICEANVEESELHENSVDESAAGKSRVENRVERRTEDLLKPIFRLGKRVYKLPDILSSQKHSKAQLEKLPPAFKKLKLKEKDHYPIHWIEPIA